MSNMEVFTLKYGTTVNSMPFKIQLLYWTALKEIGNPVLSGAEAARTGLNWVVGLDKLAC